MFGLTKREQRWKAEQQAAELLVGLAQVIVRAAADVRIAEANARPPSSGALHDPATTVNPAREVAEPNGQDNPVCALSSQGSGHALATGGVKVDGLTHLHVRTRHPQDYVLHNDQDGTRWRGTADGRWVRDDAGVMVGHAPLADGFDGSTVRPGPNHSTIEIWYDTQAQARAAHEIIRDLIDAAAALPPSDGGQSNG